MANISASPYEVVAVSVMRATRDRPDAFGSYNSWSEYNAEVARLQAVIDDAMHGMRKKLGIDDLLLQPPVLVDDGGGYGPHLRLATPEDMPVPMSQIDPGPG